MKLIAIFIPVLVLAMAAGYAPANYFVETENDVVEDIAISDVMQEAMAGRDGLLAKAVSGEATEEEKMRLLALFVGLSEATPPQGDADEWKAMTQQIVVDYAKVLLEHEGAGDVLRASANCKACHDKFKP